MAKLPKNDPKALIAAMEADLHATDGADLSGLVFKGLKVDKQILFENANLKRADFRNARLRAVGFKDSDLTGSDFSGAVLDGSYSDSAKFVQANLEGARILQSSLSSGDFSEVRARGLVVKETGWPGKLVAADLREAVLKDTSSMGVDASRADFSGADLSGGIYQESSFRDARLVDADLAKAEFEKCDLRGTDLTGAKLSNTTFAKCLWDERTRWPGEPPKGAIWKGKGKPSAGASAAPAKGAKRPSLKSIGEISSWGDPLLLVDAAQARSWTGAGPEGKSAEYRRACKAVGKGAAAPFRFGKARGVLWDVEGEGTLRVFRDAEGLVVVRAWADDDEATAAGVLAAVPIAKAGSCAILAVTSGVALLGSAFDARRLPAKASKPVSSHGDDDEALLVALPAGTYEVRRDALQDPAGEARRIFLRKK